MQLTSLDQFMANSPHQSIQLYRLGEGKVPAEWGKRPQSLYYEQPLPTPEPLKHDTGSPSAPTMPFLLSKHKALFM